MLILGNRDGFDVVTGGHNILPFVPDQTANDVAAQANELITFEGQRERRPNFAVMFHDDRFRTGLQRLSEPRILVESSGYLAR